MNYLGIENPVGLPANRHLGRPAGWGYREGRREMHVDFEGRPADFERANLVALQHIDVVDPWVVEHKTFIEKTYNDRGKQRRTEIYSKNTTLVSRVGSSRSFCHTLYLKIVLRKNNSYSPCPRAPSPT